jgi:hypothetical protein
MRPEVPPDDGDGGGGEVGGDEFVHEGVHIGGRDRGGVGVDADDGGPHPVADEGFPVHSRRGVRAIAATEAAGEVGPPILEFRG